MKLSSLLKHYDPEDKELYLKARFILIATVMMVVGLMAALTYTTAIGGLESRVPQIEIFGFIVMLCALVILVKGHYGPAIHILLISGFITVWAVLFFGPVEPLINKIDTIVFLPALFSAMPLMFFRDRRPMLAYFAVNMILFAVFNLYLHQISSLTIQEKLDYLLDNLVVLVFVFSISFALFTINRQAMKSLRKELEERKKAEKALQESETRLSTHLQNTPVGAVSMDLSHRVTEWNPAAEKIFGYTRREALGQNMAHLVFTPDRAALFEQSVEDLFKGRGGYRHHHENIARQGNRVLCDWYSTVLWNTDGEVVGAAFLINDITEIRKSQDMVIQSEKMMSIGGLAAGMAHEINNPLAGILQNAQLIHNRLAGDLKANEAVARELGTSLDVIRRYNEKRGILKLLDNIGEAGKRAARIIDNIISFSMQRGADRKPVDLAALVDKALEIAAGDYNLKKKHDFRNIDIVREYSPDLPEVPCEEGKIQQVLFNLFKNASESMGAGLDDRDPPRLIIRLKKEGDMAVMEVEDNGPGMDAEISKRVFEPFFTTKGLGEGTGLGLSVSYYIVVDHHGGQMAVEAKPGKGTRFIVRLPLKSDNPAATATGGSRPGAEETP